MKTGLVLEGGAMRGLFTAGVMDVLMENEIRFDGMVGVSAGAAFGCNYKSRQIGRVLRYNLKYCRDPRYCGLRSLILTGDIFGRDFCYRRIPEELDPFDYESYRANPMPFYAVVTDIRTGKALLHRCDEGRGEDLEWFRASASMPLVSRPVQIGGASYLDGGVADSIPLRAFEELGYGRNVVVLTQPEGYVKAKNGMLGLMRLALRKYPKLIDVMARRHEEYNAATAYVHAQEAAGRVFVIRPDSALEVSRIEHDPQRLQAAYDHGRAVMNRELEKLKGFMEEKS